MSVSVKIGLTKMIWVAKLLLMPTPRKMVAP